MRGSTIWLVLSLVLSCFLSMQAIIGEEIFLDWHVAEDNNIKPVSVDQPVITINGMFPGPLLNASTNDNIHVNVFNDMDRYPVLITWNGIQQRHNSWQDGVSGTNCEIQPGTNWTYEFQLKDQIGSFFYFPSLYYEKAGGGFGPIQVNNRVVVQPPFAEPDGDFHLLIGDWYEDSFEVIGFKLEHEGYNKTPNIMLMNGKGSYLDPKAKSNESFIVQRGKTYKLRISNVGSEWSFNFRIQNHSMLLVETEGSYTNQITLDSLDVHVGQSYSILVTADQDSADYYIVATAKMAKSTQLKTLEVVGVLHYENSTKPADGPLPNGPDPFDVNFSISQARSIRLNLTTGAARPNPQGSFNVSNVTLSQTFILQNSVNKKNGVINYAINNVSYDTPLTPLKLADYYLNGGAGVYELDKFPANSSLPETIHGTFVVSGEHKGWLEIVFKNELKVMDSWHLDGFGFFVVGYGSGNWTPKSRRTYNLYDPVVRSTVQVITINGMFPGPLLNASTNDNIHVNVFNDMDRYPVLITWNGIQQRHNSWQDGVSGTNCEIQPGTNWTYEFQLKDQIGSFFYFPSLYYEKAGGGFGPIQVNNRVVVQPPFAEPDGDFHLLIGDWYEDSFEVIGFKLEHEGYNKTPNIMLMNGKGSYLDPKAKSNESFIVQRGKTYKLRISNVGSEWSFNFRIQNHSMLLVETEGSYTNQITLDSLDVHVGQSYSVLVTADQDSADYYIVATAKMAKSAQLKTLEVVGVLHYENSTKPADGPLPNGPDPFDVNFSISQARSIRLNLTTGAARPNPQGSFDVSNVTLSQTFILQNSVNKKNGVINYAINNVSYDTPLTPLKLADYYLNGGAGVYELDKFPANSSLPETIHGTFVVSGEHKGWLEIVFKNELKVMDSWHLDGFGFFVVGYGSGNWTPKSRRTYNLYDPVVRSTVQVYPKGWTAVYVYLDNPGMWNLRSQNLKHWFLGQELYIRVYDPNPNPAKEHPPPKNLLYCGNVQAPPSAPPPSPKPVPVPAPPAPASPSSTITTIKRQWVHIIVAIFVVLII